MKKAFLAAIITGLVAGAVLLYLTNRTPEEKQQTMLRMPQKMLMIP